MLSAKTPIHRSIICSSKRPAPCGESDFAYRYFSVLWGVLLVPLLAQFGRRLAPQHGWWVGGWAAVLIAINPLHVWYAQEARMYTLLVFWGAAASYVLWRALQRPLHGRDLGRALTLYALCAFLTLYTHYTAIFLLATHLLLWAWVLWRAGYKRLIGLGLAAVLLALIPIVPLTLPRLFTGAETGYTYLSPLIMLNDLVGGFSMGVTAPPIPWLRTLLWWGMAAVLAVGLWQAGRGENGRARFLLLASYLTITLIGLALGSLLKPMYQGVRHIMLGSPAFVLLAAVALQGSRGAEEQRSRGDSALSTQHLAFSTFYFLLLTASLLSLHNLYTNPTVAKDDVRKVVAYIEERAGSDDIVVYNDAILMLVHWHYATRSDLEVTAAPIYPYPADERTAAQIAQMGNDYSRIWYIPAPSDGRDPLGHTQTWVRQAYTLRDEHFFTARSTVLKVELYDTIPLTTSLTTSTSWQWDGLPTLLALNLLDIAPRHLWVEAIWQGVPPPPEIRVVFELRGPDGRIWAGANPLVWQGEAWPTNAPTRLSYGIPSPLAYPLGNMPSR
ncbi:MAG: glycosyltransferase family 39 protein [Chloroflexi bacterium]|nr:glycosyltransferase family 39 protein [Chloroflexota bacterium]